MHDVGQATRSSAPHQAGSLSSGDFEITHSGSARRKIGDDGHHLRKLRRSIQQQGDGVKMDIWRPFRRMWIGEPCSPMVFKIPKAELEAQLRRAVDSSFLGFGARGLRGSVRNGGVTAYWNTPGFGKSWRPVFRGTIVGDDRESRLEGRFSVFRFVQV